MQDSFNTVSDFGNVREAVCVSTEKIMDACRDQDCMEDVAVYLTTASQETLENATSVKARCAELLYTDVSVEPVNYREGYYCVNLQYYYRIISGAACCHLWPGHLYQAGDTLWRGRDCKTVFKQRYQYILRESCSGGGGSGSNGALCPDRGPLPLQEG